MTKTLKKGLIAVLMFLMAVVLGVGAYTSLSVARADEFEDARGYVARFEGYLNTFIDWAKEQDEENYLDYLTEEKLLAAGNETLWSSYGLPKRLYSNNMTNAERDAVSAEHKAVWSALEKVFSTTYTYASRANATMEVVSEAEYYSGNIEKLKALEAEIGTLLNYDPNAEDYNPELPAYLDEDGSVTFTEGQMRYLAFATDNFDFMSRAKRNMDKIWENIQAAIETINAIEYYDGETMKSDLYTGEDQRIVLDSEDSFAAVEAALELVHEYDIKYVENLDVYKAAQDELKAQYDLAQSVQDLIDQVKALVEAEGYYTHKAEVAAARAAYDALADDTNAAWEGGLRDDAGYEGVENHNDLQSLVKNIDLLEEMEDKIAEIEDQIKKVEDAIAEIPNKGEDGYEYSDEFDEAVKKAEDLFEALPDDVKDHDKGNYPDGEYIVDGAEDDDDYGKLVDSRKQYDEWNKVVDDLLKLVEELIDIDALTEGDEGFEDKGRNLVDKYNEIQEKYQDGLSTEEGGELTPKQLDKFENSEFDFRGKEDEKVKEILKRIRNTILDKQAEVGVVDGDIHALYSKTVEQGECVYGYLEGPDGLFAVKAAYDALDAEVKSYSTYVGELEKMWAEYLIENVLVNVWLDTLDAMEVPACVLTWDTIDTAEEAWLALLHKCDVTVTGDILDLDKDATLEEILAVVEFEDEEIEEGLGKLQAIVAEMYATEYADYVAAIKSRDALKAKIDEVVKAMAELDTTEQEIEAIPEWVKTVEAVMKLVEELEAMDEHAIGWISENEQEAYENYQKALDMYEAYKVEEIIDNLYEGGPDDAEDQIGLDDATAIDKAREAYNDYIEEHPDGNIRNLDKLEAAEAALAKLTEELNAWMIRVIHLYNPEFSAESSREEILEELKNAEKFLGYPLNISEDADKYPEDGLTAVREAYAELVEAGSAEAKYVEAAWDLVNPDGSNTLDELSDAAIAELAKDIKAINDKFYTTDEEGNKVLNGKVPDSDDLKDIAWINERRNELFHPSQLEGLEDLLEDLDDLLASLEVPGSFFDMVEELYNEAVINGNVTNYTPYYLEILKTLFAEFNPAVQEMFTITIGEGEDAKILTFNEVVEEIEQAIADARDEEGNLPSLNGAFAEIEELRKALEAANNANDEKLAQEIAKAIAELESKFEEAQKELEGKLEKAIKDLEAADKSLEEKITGALSALDEAKSDLNKAIENAKSELNDAIEALETKLNDAITKAKDELQSNIDDLEGKVNELVKAEQAAREAGDKKLADDLAKAVADLEKKIADAKAELDGALKTAKGELEAADKKLDEKIESVSKALEDAKTELNKAIADLRSELNKAIDDLKTELEGEIKKAKDDLQKTIDELQSALDNFKATEQAAREAGDKKLADDLAKAVADLEKKIADAQSELNAALKTAKGELEAADKKLDEKINGVSTALDAAKADLNKAIADAKAELNKAIADLKTELEGEIKKAKDDLQKTIDELDKKLSGLIGETSVADQIAAAKAEIEKAITDALEAAFNFDNIEINDLSASLAAAFEEYNNKITAAYTAAIDKAVSELEAKLTGFEGDYANDLADIQAKIDAINSALATVDGTLDSLDAAIKSVSSELATVKADLEAAIKALEAKMNAADADLQAQIDALSSKISTILVLVIVLAVVLVAAVVCIILLFVKRNKANA